MSNWGYGNYKYKSAAEKKAQAAKSLARLQKKNANLEPVLIEGRKIAKTWWGSAWNDNLERYADFVNRIDRGRSYVRQGAVLDLKIHPGEVLALVQGSRKQPYQVRILIEPMKQAEKGAVLQACAGSIHSLQELVDGKFPKQLAELFKDEKGGLFPSPRDIGFGCSCPDWAGLCKHVAAALYGVGARLDQDPTLFFALRQIEIDDLITRTIAQSTEAMLEKSSRKSSRALSDDDLSGLFGIDVVAAADDSSLSDKPISVSATNKKSNLKTRSDSRSKHKTNDQKN